MGNISVNRIFISKQKVVLYIFDVTNDWFFQKPKKRLLIDIENKN